MRLADGRIGAGRSGLAKKWPTRVPRAGIFGRECGLIRIRRNLIFPLEIPLLNPIFVETSCRASCGQVQIKNEEYETLADNNQAFGGSPSF